MATSTGWEGVLRSVVPMETTPPSSQLETAHALPRYRREGGREGGREGKGEGGREEGMEREREGGR